MLGPLFSLGRIVATPGALASISEPRLRQCLQLHQYGDWGSVSQEAARVESPGRGYLLVDNGGRILTTGSLKTAISGHPLRHLPV
jgi:hypothetical protein